MTNLQFYLLLSPAIGSFVLVILAWLHQNSRLTDLRQDTDRRFDDVTRRFDDATRRFDGVDARLSALAADYRTFYGMEQKLEGRVEELSRRVA